MSIVYSGDYITFPDNTTLSTGTVGAKNRVINGDMRVDQRNAGASVTVSTGTWTLDRWHSENSQASKYTVQQSSDVPSGQGFSKSMVITSSSAYSVGSSEAFLMRHHIEGLNFADFAWGTANAKTATLSFWVKSSLTGTFSGSFRNDDNNRSYVYQYTINASNTWEYKTVTVPGDTSGTWKTDTNRGVTIYFALATGSTLNPYSQTGAWINGNYTASPSQVSIVGTNGATLYITGVQFEKGSTATSFDFRHYGTELLLCQRYCQTYACSQQEWVYIESSVSNQKWWQTPIPIPMRGGAPSVSQLGTWATGGSIGGTSSTYSSMSVQGASNNRVSWRVACAGGGGTAYTIGHTDAWNNYKVLYESEL